MIQIRLFPECRFYQSITLVNNLLFFLAFSGREQNPASSLLSNFAVVRIYVMAFSIPQNVRTRSALIAFSYGFLVLKLYHQDCLMAFHCRPAFFEGLPQTSILQGMLGTFRWKIRRLAFPEVFGSVTQ
jgi:hypothetical protein